jgi:hypothetical protein
MARTRKTVDAERVELAHLEAEALQLKIGGASYRRIAEHQRVAVGTAYKRIQNALAEITLAPASTLKAIEDERLEALVAMLWGVAMGTKHQLGERLEAARDLRRLSESRRKLHGLDAPGRRAIDVFTHDDFSILISRLEAELSQNDDKPQPSASRS